MKDTYKLIWSDEALNGLKEIISYIENKFSQKDVKKFSKKLDKRLKTIQLNPESFPVIKKSSGIRRTVISKLTTLYYKVEGESISIVSVFDNRMNPDKIIKK